MVSDSFKLTLFFIMLQILFVSWSSDAATFAVGKVHDANNCTEAGWRTIHVYLPTNPNDFEVGIVNPETGFYAANVGEAGLDAVAGEIVFARVVDNGDGYDAGPVQLVYTSVGSNFFPDMYLRKPGIEPDPDYPGCLDVDNDFINDVSDNCIFTPNVFQIDNDKDDIGDECDKCDGSCPCDAANLDGLDPVDFKDFSLIAHEWLHAGAGLSGDVDGNEKVNIIDLAIVVRYWLSPCN